MVSIITFFIVFVQLALVAGSYFLEMKQLFGIVMVQLSPVMVFFAGLESVLNFSGEFSIMFLPALFYCLIKYVLIAMSLKNDELGFFNFGALAMEIIYVALSSYYVVSNSYF